MNNYYKYIIFIFGLSLICLGMWFFRSIVAYIIISAVLSLMGAPVVSFLGNLKIKNYSLPKSLCAAIALITIWGVCLLFFWIFVPLIALEAQKISMIDLNKILAAINTPIASIDEFVKNMGIKGNEGFSTVSLLSEKIKSLLSFGLLTDIFGTLASAISSIFIALFSISFITFFFLKDEKLFGQAILLLVPTKHEISVRRVLSSTKNLLMRYFLGIGAQILGIIILVTIGFLIVGIDFRTGLVIALFAGIMNVIPYIGPLIGMIFGSILGLTSKVMVLTPEQFLPLWISILVVFLIVHLIDNIVFQPFIFSNSVKAHPLEIFIVLLVAGHLAGITGMLLAIPGYTVIRVIAKQFLNNFKIVKKLTEKI
jgi:predicted PurR-regulated permease PerM